MHGKYAILCNEKGGVLNDPVLLRLSEDEFWFSISDSDLLLWLQGVNVGKKFDVEIDEIDVCPVQIQGPLSEDLMAKLAGEELREIPYLKKSTACSGSPRAVPTPGSPHPEFEQNQSPHRSSRSSRPAAAFLWATASAADRRTIDATHP